MFRRHMFQLGRSSFVALVMSAVFCVGCESDGKNVAGDGTCEVPEDCETLDQDCVENACVTVADAECAQHTDCDFPGPCQMAHGARCKVGKCIYENLGDIYSCDFTAVGAADGVCLAGECVAGPRMTVTRSGDGGGRVVSTPSGIDCGATTSQCGATFAFNQSVVLVASADGGSGFTGWGGDCSGTNPVCTLTMSASRNVVATFALDATSRLLTVEKEGNGASAGSVTSAPAGISCGATCSASYSDGTSVTLTATSGADNAFDGWGEAGASCGTATTCTISMTQARTVTASFTLATNTHALSVYKQGTGAGTVTSSTGGINCGSTCGAAYAHGTTVTLTAAPNGDSTFGGWSGGGCSGIATTCLLAMTENKDVTATFIGITQLLTVTKAGTGQGTVSATGLTCSGSTCTGTYNYNAAVTLTASPTAGNTFAGWSGDGSSCGTAANCPISMTQDRNVTATFTVNTSNYTLTVTKAGTGTGTITATPALSCSGNTCTGTFAGGTPVSITATPDNGSTFAGWGGACGSGTGTCSLNISSNTSATATFNTQVTTYALTVTKAGTGTGTVTSNPAGISCGSTCSYSYNSGTSVTLTAAPGASSTFAGWSGDGTSCGTTATCVVTMSAAKSVTATFNTSGTTYALTVVKSGTDDGCRDGSTVVSTPAGINCGADCNESFANGTAVTLSQTSDSACTFAGWTGDGTSCGTAATCVVTMGAAKSVTAIFIRKTYTLTVIKSGTGTGTVTANPAGISCGTTCSYSYNSDYEVTLSAAVGTNSTFAGWSGDGASCGTAATCVVTMSAAKNVTATFNTTGPSYALTVDPTTGSGLGTVTSSSPGINCGSGGSDCTESYVSGTTITLTAAPNAISNFAGWSGDKDTCTTATTCVLTMDRARNVTATFALKTYTLTVTKSGTGTVISTSHAGISCGSDCDEAYDYGTSVTLSAQPGANHVFSAWSGGGCSGTGTCVVSLVTATMVSATFVPSYILWVSKTGNGASGGTVTSTPGGINCGDACMNSFAQGAQVTLTATTLNGFIFSNWSAPDCSIASTCVVNATANITVVARFLVSGSGYGGLRLEDGGARWGRLGVLYGGVWGTVYYHLFGPPSATVACRELGFAEGLPMFAPSGGSGPIWMDDVNCNGREANITQCPFEGWGVEYANHGGDMGVICCPSSCSLEYGGARIAEGGDHGRLEVLFVGDWGTVGSRYFDDKDAKVACVNMGYDDGYSIGTVVADGSGPVWMNRLECTGMETSLDDCDFGERYSFGDNPQDHPYDVGVHCCDGTCPNPYGGSRIDGGGSSGRLEVQYAGIWGTVNFWGFDDVDAHVACRENGYDTGTVLPEESVPDGSGPVWMANLRCAGYESGIGACPFGTEDRGTWGSTGYATHDNDIGVQCVGTYVPTYTIYVQTYGNGYVIGRDWNGQWPEILCGDYDGGYSCYDQCSVEVPEGTQYYFYTQAQGSHTYWGDDCGGFAAGQTCEITMERNTMYVSADFSCSSSCITCTW